MFEEVFLLSVPFRSQHFDAFWPFSVLLGHSIHILHIID